MHVATRANKRRCRSRGTASLVRRYMFHRSQRAFKNPMRGLWLTALSSFTLVVRHSCHTLSGAFAPVEARNLETLDLLHNFIYYNLKRFEKCYIYTFYHVPFFMHFRCMCKELQTIILEKLLTFVFPMIFIFKNISIHMHNNLYLEIIN